MPSALSKRGSSPTVREGVKRALASFLTVGQVILTLISNMALARDGAGSTRADYDRGERFADSSPRYCSRF
jgi:hypothetical protein